MKRMMRSPIWVGMALLLAAATSVQASDEHSTTVSTRPESHYKNGVGMEFILIPAGSFKMGSTDGADYAYAQEKPSHQVTISQPFYLATTEVTQAQWETVMGSNPYSLERSNPYYHMPGMKDRITRPNHPATVSWQDAQNFIQKLNVRESTNRYRLPTEAEWEYAARAGTQTRYSFGDNKSDLDQYAWYGGNFLTGGTHPVATKRPNPWGLYDMHGNAWEWVQDFYSDTYYQQSPTQDPQGPTQGEQHVVRSGSWHSTADGWHSAMRKGYPSDYRGISIGFRVAMNANGNH